MMLMQNCSSPGSCAVLVVIACSINTALSARWGPDSLCQCLCMVSTCSSKAGAIQCHIVSDVCYCTLDVAPLVLKLMQVCTSAPLSGIV